jgi:cytochrome c-type biogenesis protein CcmH/NrfF
MQSFLSHLPAGRIAGLLLLILVAGLAILPASAQDDPAPGTTMNEQQIHQEASRLHSKFMSPFCPGKNLKDCTSSQAAVWRDQIEEWVGEGRDEKWIEAQLIDEFGEQILSAPKFKGFNTLVWLFPGIVLLVGLAVIFNFLQRQHGIKLDETVPGWNVSEDFQADPALEARLERELDSRTR